MWFFKKLTRHSKCSLILHINQMQILYSVFLNVLQFHLYSSFTHSFSEGSYSKAWYFVCKSKKVPIAQAGSSWAGPCPDTTLLYSNLPYPDSTKMDWILFIRCPNCSFRKIIGKEDLEWHWDVWCCNQNKELLVNVTPNLNLKMHFCFRWNIKYRVSKTQIFPEENL